MGTCPISCQYHKRLHISLITCPTPCNALVFISSGHQQLHQVCHQCWSISNLRQLFVSSISETEGYPHIYHIVSHLRLGSALILGSRRVPDACRWCFIVSGLTGRRFRLVGPAIDDIGSIESWCLIWGALGVCTQK